MRYLLYLTLLVSLPTFGAQNLRILLTNDDGFESPGIKALQQALRRDGHDVFVIAPATQQSGKSAAVTARGVRFTPYQGQIWAVEGTPADAVRLGLGYIMYNNPPDLVVSGANFGQNTGQDVHISGTVGAALTAYRLGVPAIAVSVAIKIDEAERGFPSTIGALSGAARVTARLVRNMSLSDMTAVLNVNYPAALPLDVKGVRWTPLSQHSIIGTRYYRQSDGTYAPELQEPHQHARAYDAESVLDDYVTLTFLDGDTFTPTQRGQRYLARDLLDSSYEPTYQPPTKRDPAPPRRQQPENRDTPIRVPGSMPSATVRKPSQSEQTEPAIEPRPIVREAPAREVPGRAAPTPAAPVQAAPTPAAPIRETQIRERKPANPVIKLGTEEQAEIVRPPPSETQSDTRRRIPVREEVIIIPDRAPPRRQVIPGAVIADPQTDTTPAQDQLPPPTAAEQQAEAEAAAEAEAEEASTKEKPDSWLRRMFDPGSWRR